MKYMIITQVKFWQKKQGCDHIVNNRFDYLSGDKALLYIGHLNDEDRKVLEKYHIKVMTMNPISFVCMRYFRFFLSKIRCNVFYFLKKPFNFSIFAKRKVRKICIQNNVERVVVEYVWLAHLVEKIPSNIIKIIDTHDIQNQFCSLYKKTNKYWKVDVKEKEEMALYRNFDFVIALSTGDRDYFAERIDNVYYLPPIYKENSFKPVNKEKLSVGFIGGTAQFNFDAVDWFVKNVFDKLENVEFNVYGTVCKLINYDLPNVNLVGAVDDLAIVYENNHIMVNPTFMIGGIKTKNVEALSYGKIVLTTTYGARGLETFVPSNIITICDTPEQYITVINEYKKDLDEFNKKGAFVIQEFEKEFSKENVARFEEKIEEKIKEKNRA